MRLAVEANQRLAMLVFASLLISLLENTLVLIKNTFKDGASPQRLAYMLLLNESWSKTATSGYRVMANPLFPIARKESISFLRSPMSNTGSAQATSASRGVGRRSVVIGRMFGLTSSGENCVLLSLTV